MIDAIKKTYASLDQNHPTKVKIVRYVISGGTAAFVDLSLLYVFTDIFGIWYILSSIVAFLIAFIVSFTLQKFWTFKDNSRENISSQVIIYLVVTSLNLGLNTLGIYAFVHYLTFYYLAAQIIVSLFIAVESYFVYHLVFKNGKGGDQISRQELL